MARKAAPIATQSSHTKPKNASVVWWDHLDSIKKFHCFPPYPKQPRQIALAAPKPNVDNAASHSGPQVISLRSAGTQFRLTGSHVEEPVEEIVRTVPIVQPTVEVVASLHEIALLTAEYFDLLWIKRRNAVPSNTSATSVK